MYNLALALLLGAFLAAIFGFELVGDWSYDVAKVLCVLFLVLATFSFLADAFSRQPIEPV